jgi:hypothetical protein
VVRLYAGSDGGGSRRPVRCGKIVGSISDQCHVRHRVEGKRGVGAARIDPRCGEAAWGQSFSDEQDDAKRFLHDPVLKIENAKSRECDQAEKREQLIAPLH